MAHRVHMRKLRSNGVHPRATKDGILRYDSASRLPEASCSYVIEIQGDVIGLLIIPPSEPNEIQHMEELVLWNWTTGDVLNVGICSR